MATTPLPRCGEYALRAMAYLAGEPGRVAVAREIAAATEVPVNYLQKILSTLSRAGLLRAQRGLGGGFCLSRPASEISMRDVFRAVDAGVQRITRCPLGRPGHAQLCRVHRRLDEAYAMIDEVFRTTSLAALLADEGEAGCEAGSGPSGESTPSAGLFPCTRAARSTAKVGDASERKPPQDVA